MPLTVLAHSQRQIENYHLNISCGSWNFLVISVTLVHCGRSKTAFACLEHGALSKNKQQIHFSIRELETLIQMIM